jgi:hypothetical protein
VVDDAPDGDQDGTPACEDCDDTNPLIVPGQVEACDGLDNDCNGIVDDPWDLDGDGGSSCAGDCDDRDPTQSGHLPEICDLKDNDCDGLTDEDFDLDADGFLTCEGDCDDSDALVSPIADEVCDGGLDTDCDGVANDFADVDGDGFDLCTDNDCNDAQAGIYPGATETCNGADDDCDGLIDELPECSNCTQTGAHWVCTTGRSWAMADAACQGFAGGLAVVNDAAEQSAIAAAADPLVGAGRYWIGLSDTALEGTFVWRDGSALGFSSWAVGEPNGGNASDCVQGRGATTTWSDADCATLAAFVCE